MAKATYFPDITSGGFVHPKTWHFTSLHMPSTDLLLTIFVTLVLLILASALWIWRYSQYKSTDIHGNSIPHGPLGLPIVGSFPFLTRYPELTLDFWAQKFGRLYSVWLGNQLFVIVSEPQIAKDLLVTNGAIFSSRKAMFVKSQTVFLERGITATPYTDRWRKHRRIAVTWLNQRAVDTYTHVLEREAAVLIKSLYNESQAGLVPINPQPHAGRCSLNNMTTITFGLRTDSIHHSLVGQALRLSREFMNCTGPVSNLVDFIPLLQKLPTQMRTRGTKLNDGLVLTYGGMIKEIEQNIVRGVAVDDCLAKTMLSLRKEENLDDLDMAILASAFMIGGVETTASIMQWFSALIPAHPDIQRKAQEELDRVVGRGRLPTTADEANLPYCRAIIKEVERCHNPFWLGTPHLSSEDFTYNNMFIPKNTVVMLNTWTMHYDANRHKDPSLFSPDRYLSDAFTSAESASLPDPYQRDHWMFGAGRRICPGMIVAEREIFLAISRMLWAFTMTELPGEPIDLKEYDGLSGRSPVAFRVLFTPRHERVSEIVQNACEGYL